MSYHHAQGPLTADARLYLRDKHDNIIARLAGTTGKYESEEMNARRLVACWNACEGITTERLEDLGRPLMQHLIGCDERAARQVKEAADLTSQRGTLLAALRCAIKKAPELITVPSIRSAIENAEGGR